MSLFTLARMGGTPRPMGREWISSREVLGVALANATGYKNLRAGFSGRKVSPIPFVETRSVPDLSGNHPDSRLRLICVF
jgi:hypothetical protein